MFSFYDNQEVIARGYCILALFSVAFGFAFLGLLLFFLAILVSDEDRLTEEELLDSSEPTLHYSLSVQREKIAQYLRRKGSLYKSSKEESRHFYDYLGEEYLYEKRMLAEIYEFPLSTILSNNYYLIPGDEEHHFFRLLHFPRKIPQPLRRRRNLDSNLGKSPGYPLSLRARPWLLQIDWEGPEAGPKGERLWLSSYLLPFAQPPKKAKIRIEHKTITSSDG